MQIKSCQDSYLLIIKIKTILQPTNNKVHNWKYKILTKIILLLKNSQIKSQT